MSYAQISDLVERYGADEMTLLTDRADPPLQTYDTGVLQQALNDADSIVNSYLAAQVTIPLVTVPAIINLQECKIARFLLWKDRRSEAVTADYNDALAWLKQVAQGLIPIGGADAPAPAASVPKVVASKHIFTRHKLRDF